MSARALTCAALAVLTLTRAAHARDPELPPASARTHWYGWQTITVDLAAVGTTVVGANLPRTVSPLREVAISAGVLAFALGSPIIHWSKGHVGRGFASLGIHLGSPLIVGLVGLGFGSRAERRRGESDALFGFEVGALVGAVAASTVDAVALAREEVEEDVTDEADDDDVEAHARAITRPADVQLFPTGGYDPKTGTASAGVGGVF